MMRFGFSLAVVCVAVPLIAQEDFSHPELEWKTIKTEHFMVHYHNGAARTGNDVARIAEAIYQPITAMYQHEPDQRVSIVIRDHDDYSNGAAYFYDNKIEIWAPSLDFELRGTHPWLLNVVTHEFTHIVQMQTAMKFGRRVPAVYLQWLGYEEERRPDVLYGFPNVLVSYPISGFVVPSWFAEGVAQFNHPDLLYDFWDSHRDMILRMHMLEGTPLSWEEMAVFGKSSLGNESSYNAGFSIIEFVAARYGNEKVAAISKALASPGRLTIDGAIEQVLGKSGPELYEEWKQATMERYSSRAREIQPQRLEGNLIEAEGFGNFYPAYSADGTKLAYVSNKGKDYFGLSSVYVYDVARTQVEELPIQTRSSLAFSPDGMWLYYSKSTRENPHWSNYSDLYRYNLQTKDEERLTRGWRAFNPTLSRDGRKLAYATGSDGTLNLATCSAEGKNFRLLTEFSNGEQVFTPSWSPDGSTIAFGYSRGHRQSIMLVDSSGNAARRISWSGDSRTPHFSPDGKHLFFSNDSGGVFNIYCVTLASGEVHRVTNVLGGAFLPTVGVRGNLAFALYKNDGYKIATISQQKLDSLVAQPSFTRISFAADQQKIAPQDSSLVSSDYRSVFSSTSLIPFLRYDNYNASASGLDVFKPGMFFVSTEVLDKLSLFGSVAMNRSFERDFYFAVEYRDRLPLLYQLGFEPDARFEAFNVTRKLELEFDLFTDRLRRFSTELQFNLLEFDFSLIGKIFNEHLDYKLSYALSRYSQDFGHWVYIDANRVPPAVDIPGSRSVYLVANAFGTDLTYDGIQRSVNKDINPVGRTIRLKYGVELNKFNPSDSAKYENGFRVPVYTDVDIQRLEVQWSEHVPALFQNHTFSVGLRGGSILGESVDDFFDFYAGGLLGMRGYSFYSLGGNEYAALNLTYRFPLATKLEARFLQFYFTKLYASVFVDIGDAWTGTAPPVDSFRKDAGFELRLESFSFYSYPTRLFFSGAYGFDQFSRRVYNTSVVYGQEWRWYFGILFDFEFGSIQRTIREWR